MGDRVREFPEGDKVYRGPLWTLPFPGTREGLFKAWGPICLALKRVLMESMDVKVCNE